MEIKGNTERPPEDIRIIKSKRALLQALILLLEKKSFAKISVNDICEAALVSRTTFYTHFEDKYALVRFGLQILRNDMERNTQELHPKEVIRAVLRHIRENTAPFKNLLLADPNVEMGKMFHGFFTEAFLQALTANENDSSAFPAEPEFIASFYAGGTAAAIIQWIGSGFKGSAERLADNLYGLVSALA